MYNLVMLYVVVVAGFFGLVCGSAVNALVWRISVGRSWARGRSICPECEHVLSPLDLIPVASWLWLGGKCRYCKVPIKDHPAVELLTAVAFAVSAYGLAHSTKLDFIRLGFWLVILTMLIALAVYDARWLLLPDKVMLPLIGVSFGYVMVLAIVSRTPAVFVNYLAAAMVAGGVFYAIVFFSKGRAMGGGDIKLAFAMGLILGTQGTILALFLAFNLAALVGIGLIVAGVKGRKDQIPFGPFLVTATMVAFVFGPQIVHWYVQLSGL